MRKQEVPEAKYTKFGEKIRHVIPGPMQCSMACGGRNCKWENPSRWSDQDQVIKGVFSSWVLDDVVAMSRPSTEVIQKYDLIKQFKESNICSIINLQRPGEHASCGPPLHKESQFTYEPQVFMDNDVFFYNFGWKDYGVASLETILDMVKVMAFALSEGKVAVHCHAGLGRTGVLIACYLVYAHRMDASSAINTVRKRRANSIQTRGQIACIQEFAQFLKPLRIVFPQVVPHAERLSLVQFLHRQRHLLHGSESRDLRHLPKIVNVVCQRLVEIATTSQDIGLYDNRVRLNTGPKPRSAKKKRAIRRSNTIETLKETIPGAFVNEQIDSKETSSDPLDSQKMNALLSPRFYRRSESAKSKSSSGSKSQSRPESPVTFLAAATDIPTSSGKPKTLTSDVQTSTPILVAPQPVFVGNQDTETVLEKVSGQNQVVLVKQGSRPGLLCPAANLTHSQPSSDNNLNNNNQIVCFGDSEAVVKLPSPPMADDKACVEKPPPPLTNDPAKDADAPRVTTPDSPSPTPFAHEPQLSSRVEAKSLDQETQNAAGDKPPILGRRASAGRQQRVVPTGMPARGRIGSSKGKNLALLAGDSNMNVDDNIVGPSNDDDAVADKKLEGVKITNGAVEDIAKDENVEDEVTEVEQTSAVDQLTAEMARTKETFYGDESLDQELDEIIEIKDDGGVFLSESDSEKDDAKLEKDDLAKFSTPKMSWFEKKGRTEDGNSEESRDEAQNEPEKQNASFSREHTPLMYRGEKTQELIGNQDSNGLESDTEDCDANAEKLNGDCVSGDSSDSDNRTSLKKDQSQERKRPKSAGFSKKLSEQKQHGTAAKKPHLKKLTLTQSLCDLRNYSELSCDELAMMKSGMTPDLFLPLSPSSKSSSSDDVRTPTSSATKKRLKDPISVAMALAYKLTDNEWLWEKVYTKQVELNTREGAWSTIEQEFDAHLLSCLMWSWIEHLSAPVLAAGDVESLIKESRPSHEKSSLVTECPDPILFEKALADLGKPISSTLRCVLHCLTSLPQLSYELELSVIKRVTAAFTQATVQGSVSEENLGQRNSHEQLVCLIQNYLVKTRARNLKKQSSTEIGENSDNKDRTDKTDAATLAEKASKEPKVSKTEFARGEGEGVSASSASKVSELPSRIAVS